MNNVIQYRRHAYIRQDLSWLKSYLSMTPEQEAEDLAQLFPHLFVEWALSLPEEQLPSKLTWADLEDARAEPWDIVDKWAREFDQTLLVQFRAEGSYQYALNEDPTRAPSYLYFDTPELIKNRWLIHFTGDADSIQRQGFTTGMDDLQQLGLTDYIDVQHKPGGYNFAFLLDDFDHYGRDPMDYRSGWKYGPEAVLFRADGLRVWHSGDGEPQVIFWGADATDVVVLEPSGFTVRGEEQDGWVPVPCGGQEPPYGAEDLSAVVQWVVDNFDQYRNVLTCR